MSCLLQGGVETPDVALGFYQEPGRLWTMRGGIVIGTLMGRFRTVEYALDVYINAAMAAPMVAFVPIFILIFGIGYPTRVLTVVIFAIFPIIVNTFAGIRNVDPSIVEMGRSFGAGERQLFWQIRVPAAFRLLSAGIRLGTAAVTTQGMVEDDMATIAALDIPVILVRAPDHVHALKDLDAAKASLFLVDAKVNSRAASWNVRQAVLGVREALYRFDHLKTQKKANGPALEHVTRAGGVARACGGSALAL